MTRSDPSIRRLVALAVALATGALVLGCAGSGAPVVGARAGLSCVDDSPECIGRRQQTLRALVADHTRSWVREPASAEAYASGVRLFAFKSRKKDLPCDDLAHGRREADAAPGVLRGPAGKGLTTAQVARGIMFAQEVSRELGNEMGRRCRRG